MTPNDVMRSVAMLARLGSRSGRPGDWLALARRVDTLQQRSTPDFVERLHEAEYLSIVRLVSELMLPTTRHSFLRLVEARAEKELSLGAWVTTQVERLFVDIGEPWTIGWKGGEDLSRARAPARTLEAAIRRYVRSRNASDLARVIGILETSTRRVRQEPAAPTRYSIQSLFQMIVAEPLLRALAPTHWHFVMSYLMNETAWNFDGKAFKQNPESPPWNDPRNGVHHPHRYNAISLSYEPLASRLMRQFIWSGYPSIKGYGSGPYLVEGAEELVKRDIREGRSDIWLYLTGAR